MVVYVGMNYHTTPPNTFEVTTLQITKYIHRLWEKSTEQVTKQSIISTYVLAQLNTSPIHDSCCSKVGNVVQQGRQVAHYLTGLEPQELNRAVIK